MHAFSYPLPEVAESAELVESNRVARERARSLDELVAAIGDLTQRIKNDEARLDSAAASSASYARAVAKLDEERREVARLSRLVAPARAGLEAAAAAVTPEEYRTERAWNAAYRELEAQAASDAREVAKALEAALAKVQAYHDAGRGSPAQRFGIVSPGDFEHAVRSSSRPTPRNEQGLMGLSPRGSRTIFEAPAPREELPPLRPSSPGESDETIDARARLALEGVRKI